MESVFLCKKSLTPSSCELEMYSLIGDLDLEFKMGLSGGLVGFKYKSFLKNYWCI